MAPSPEDQSFYPTVQIDYKRDDAPFGAPQPETLRRFSVGLSPRSRVLDVGGASGSYAFMLAASGHNVTIFDIDDEALEAARKRTERVTMAGSINTVQGNILEEGALNSLDNDYDGMLIAGFLYLLHPSMARKVFQRSASVLKAGGLAVVEFNTDITRKDEKGSLDGRTEHKHTTEGGRILLASMFEEAGFTQVQYAQTTAQHDEPFYYRATVTVASGILQQAQEKSAI